MSNNLIEILSTLDMTVNSGLVFTAEESDIYNESELLAVDQAKKLGAAAVYFKRSSVVISSIPQVYIYDYDLDDEGLIDIHRKLWSSGAVPFFFIITTSQVKIFSCTRKAKREPEGNIKIDPLKIFDFASGIVDEYEYQKFSARLFDSGVFWQQEEYLDLLDPANRPYETLLEGLLLAKKDLSIQASHKHISENTISKLLIMCILIKYLSEKTDDTGNKLFSINRDFYTGYGKGNQRVEQFTDVLRQGHAVTFFRALSEKFSGNVFDFSIVEQAELAQADLSFVADVFDARIERSGNYVLWDLYSFNHLPIELISGIYEAFLKDTNQSGGNKGIVYTPPYLVNFLIDECMPLHKAEEYFAEEEFKILDPACGSGIFLVSAFKRLIQWKAIINYKATGRIQYPELGVVKRIITNNVFGIDIEKEATRLTIFSLCIAICEKLSPMEIWTHLQFDDLSINNIKNEDLFGYIDREGLTRESFDLVIGNPPFNPPSGITNKAYFNYLFEKYQIRPSAPINDSNLALFFLDRCMRFPKRGKNTCLILPAGAWLYNNNSQSYRNHFIENHIVSKIIDFTHLSDILFYGRANIAICAVIAQNESPVKKPSIQHIVVHRAKVAEKRYLFEIDHYDFHNVRFQTALDSTYVWKANLLGGGRLLRLIERLSKLGTIKDYLIKKKTDNGWRFGEGYIVGHDGSSSEEVLLEKKFQPADWITGHPSVITESFTEDNNVTTVTEEAKLFRRPRNKQLYEPPHVLIREVLGTKEVPIMFSDRHLGFKHQVLGIHAPASERAELKSFYDQFKANSSLYRFYLISTSGRAGVSLSSTTLLESDIMNLPYSPDERDLTLSKSEEIVRHDVANYFIKLGISTENSILFSPTTEEIILNFGDEFCQTLNPIYKNYGQFWQLDSYWMNEYFVGCAFCYGEKKVQSIINWESDYDSILNRLMYNENQRNARITRVLKAYEHNSNYDLIIMIKPNLLRFWLKSTALRDADETFADLKRAGF